MLPSDPMPSAPPVPPDKPLLAPRPALVESPVAPRARLSTPGDERTALLMLLIATFAWGFSFVWVKQAVGALNDAAGVAAGSAFGAALLLAMRFGVATMVWFAIFPRAREGWSLDSHRRVAILGLLLAAGIVIQTMGLDLTSEAVSAFLTSLAVVFVPLIVAALYRVFPSKAALLGIVLAVAGVWTLTGASFQALGFGEILGLACSVVFSLHLIGVNRLTTGDTPWRMCGGQFAWVALSMTLVTLLVMPPPTQVRWAVFGEFVVWGNLLLLVAIPTLVSFGLMTAYQPFVHPNRAVMIYLLEPAFAGAIAWVLNGSAMTGHELLGGGLILLANAVVELLTPRRKPEH